MVIMCSSGIDPLTVILMSPYRPPPVGIGESAAHSIQSGPGHFSIRELDSLPRKKRGCPWVGSLNLVPVGILPVVTPNCRA